MNDRRHSLKDTLARVQSRLVAAPHDRNCPFRTPVFATAGVTGPEARLVVLREVGTDPFRVVVHTDAASAKVAELRENPRATLLFWDPTVQLQIRVRALVSIRFGTADEWADIPDAARRAYGGAPAPGTVIAHPLAHQPLPEAGRHMILTAEPIEIETLMIDKLPHVRALFRAKDGFLGRWLAP